jgi:hypothetical protein
MIRNTRIPHLKRTHKFKDKCSNVVDRMKLELEGKFLDFLRIRTRILEWFQGVSADACIKHAQQDYGEQWRDVTKIKVCDVPARRSAGPEV